MGPAAAGVCDLLEYTMSASSPSTDHQPDAWSPQSWRQRTALQMPTYPDAAALEHTLDELRQLPPLVTSWEIFALKRQLAEAQEGKRFLLQGGDCAENFSDCESGTISNRLYTGHGIAAAATGGVRLCPTIYNTVAHIDRAIAAVETLMG